VRGCLLVKSDLAALTAAVNTSELVLELFSGLMTRYHWFPSMKCPFCEIPLQIYVIAALTRHPVDCARLDRMYRWFERGRKEGKICKEQNSCDFTLLHVLVYLKELLVNEFSCTMISCRNWLHNSVELSQHIPVLAIVRCGTVAE
jgi:hypothetical protein